MHVLIAPPGAGNIGDQAMVEAFLASADRTTVVVARDVDDFVIPATSETAPGSSRSRPCSTARARANRDDLRRLGALISDAATVSIVGADIMDGVYVLRSSLRRSAVAAACARGRGRHDRPRVQLERGGPASRVGPCARPERPASGCSCATPPRRRASSEAGVAGVVETADIVFTDDRVDDVGAERMLPVITAPRRPRQRERAHRPERRPGARVRRAGRLLPGAAASMSSFFRTSCAARRTT